MCLSIVLYICPIFMSLCNSAIKDHVARGIVLEANNRHSLVGGIVGRAHKLVGKYACAVDRAA